MNYFSQALHTERKVLFIILVIFIFSFSLIAYDTISMYDLCLMGSKVLEILEEEGKEERESMCR